MRLSERGRQESSGIIMAPRKENRKLGRRYPFVKQRLLRLPQESLAWEADFCPLPPIPEAGYGFWLGVVVDHHSGSVLMATITEQMPTEEDIADLLAAAMERSATGVPCRPEGVLLRDNPDWEGLLPFLGQLGIDALVTENLSCWNATAEELIAWIKDHWSRRHKVLVETEESVVFETLFDLRGIAYGFVFFGQHEDK